MCREFKIELFRDPQDFIDSINGSGNGRFIACLKDRALMAQETIMGQAFGKLHGMQPTVCRKICMGETQPETEEKYSELIRQYDHFVALRGTMVIGATARGDSDGKGYIAADTFGHLWHMDEDPRRYDQVAAVHVGSMDDEEISHRWDVAGNL